MDVFQERRKIFAACAKGVPPILRQEMEQLRFPIEAELDGGIETSGTMTDCMAMCLHLWTAQRVMYELAAFRAQTPDHLYHHVTKIHWEDVILEDGYFTVTSFIQTPSIRDPRFANMRCKDAIVDRIRRQRDQRPNSGNERTGVMVFLYWYGETCRVYLDASGETLSRRGYRKLPMEAPLQESLAAALLKASGWTPGQTLVNPMCGSGTIAIEAALMASGQAPGLIRSDYAFTHVKGYDPAKWESLRKKAMDEAARRAAPSVIISSDIRRDAVDAARKNAQNAGVEHLIDFQLCDFAETRIPVPPGIIMLNPEYGHRLGDTTSLTEEYFRIGDFFKKQCKGFTGYVFTGNAELAKSIGLRSTRKIMFYNGPKECRLLRFEIYEGSKRASKQPSRPPPSDEEPMGS